LSIARWMPALYSAGEPPSLQAPMQTIAR
jgi:hypothetical protein